MMDGQNTRRRHWVTGRDGVGRWVEDDLPLQDGERIHLPLMMNDGARTMPGTMTIIDAAMLADAERRLEDGYGPGAGCLARYSDGAKARTIIDAAKSGEVYRVEGAVDAALGMVRRTKIDPRLAGGVMRDSDDVRTAVATLMTRVADEARGRAAAMRAGYTAAPEDPRRAQRFRDAAGRGPAAVAHAELEDRLSNAWRNR